MDSKKKNREVLKSQIKDSFGRVVYTYTAHHKCADRKQKLNDRIKITEIVLTACSAAGFFATIITNQIVLSWVGGIFSVLSLGVCLFTKDFDLTTEIQKHKDAADDLWLIREQYVSLITDFDELDTDVIREKRDRLMYEVDSINHKYPSTDSKSYIEAQKALKFQEEQTFNTGEVDTMLPTVFHENKTEEN